MSFWSSVNADFSEIDTSDVVTDVNLNNLTSFDLKDIISDEHSLTNTDYINHNYESFEKEMGAMQNINKETELSARNTDGGQNNSSAQTFETNKETESSAINTGGGENNSSAQAIETEVDLRLHHEVNHRGKQLEYQKDKSMHKITGNNEERLKSWYPCIVCKKKFAEKSSMKAHVKARHLRHVVLCNVCGKRLFQDRLQRHEEEHHKQDL
eukprot:GFUD01030327.1.p1 GENE.GFUD01030327.1~~GFUD01030327.1.p1  ORF type:complete len:211 (-),score=57.52 GFUD01030327.1:54-686(-)